MDLIKKKTEVINYPKRLLIYGTPKAGKSTAISNLKDALIIDTENGYEALTGNIVNVKEIEREEGYKIVEILGELYKALKEENPYKYLVFDTIDNIESDISKIICEENDVIDISDLPFGKGYTLVRNRILNILDRFQELGLNIIIIGHRKLTVAADANIVKMNDIGLTGKLKDFLFASCDAIGFGYREKEEDVEYFKLSFIPTQDDSIIAGSRIANLNGKEVKLSKLENNKLKFNWEEIYPQK